VLQRRAGPKGHGLYTDQDLAAGQFVIQYVGEVLEEEEYLRRKHYYIQTGQRHYYFMNIGNGEVIDACRKVSAGSNDVTANRHGTLWPGTAQHSS
jgi:histone-lysine N-methyltransferase SETD2